LRSTPARLEIAAWLIAVGGIAVLAGLHVPNPLSADAAMFVWGARELADGARLYVDFWDMKQPGIFWFCQVAGELFGFDAVGIHLLEAIWQVCLAIVLIVVARWFVRDRLLAYLAPLFCFAPYYLAHFLTMVEMLVSLPLTILLACVLGPQGTRHVRIWGSALAGVMIVVVAAFKLMLVPIAASIAVWGLIVQWRSESATRRAHLSERVLAMAGGFALALALLAAYLAYTGSLRGALWTAFVYPPIAIEQFPHRPLSAMARPVGWLATNTWMFAILGVVAWFGPDRAARRPLVWALTLWLAIGAALVTAQSLSRWTYHMQLFLVPLALFGVLGLDAAWSMLRLIPQATVRRVSMAICVLGVLLVMVARPLWQGVAYPIWASAPWTAGSLREYQERVDGRLSALRESAAFLSKPDAMHGRVAMLGDARVLEGTGRRPVPEINGWTYYLTEQLDSVAASLETVRPPYAYVSWYVAQNLRNGTDAVFTILERDYVRIADDEAEGTWFALRGANAVTATPQAKVGQ